MSDGTIVAENAAATGAAEEPMPVDGTAEARQEHVRDAGASGHEALADATVGSTVPGSEWSAAGGDADVVAADEHDPEAHGPQAVVAGAPASGSRAGRNLPAALAVGFGLGLSLIAILLFVPKVFIGVVGVAVGVATWEVAKRLREADVLVPRIPLIVGGQAVFWLGWPYGASGVAGAFAATTLTCMVWRLFDHGLQTAPRNFLRDTAITIFTLAWIPLLASFATLLLLEDDGNLRVLTFMILVVCSDVGGYVAGVLFGRHPMVPSISPKKSWEGFGGSLVFSVIGGLLTVTLLLDANSMIGVVLGVGLVLVATCGDLIESQIKRELGIKDMGTLLPGHGGIMDRLDSMLPSAFVSWLVLSTLL
ncbi:phosphatidate cytidylyltransferase [Nocardia brasiliensis]|uniref:phosphatidate cytidylyltransferase n=1 Tax=Nocardia brasiliensis TaxID=37326 RepID=UPI000AEE025F|nr:phosphatidate cytidylyltransferase [Nocardia brasiliensis]